MHPKALISLAMLLAMTAPGLPVTAAEPDSSDTKQSDRAPEEIKAYFLHIGGRALPLRQALVNGVNVLGGAVISLSLPVNISGYTKGGLNTLVLDYTSDPKASLVVTVEKRTPGPKTEQIAKIEIEAGDSKGAAKSRTISFNLPADGGAANVGELSDSDKAAIKEQFEHYYKALASARADQVRALYRQSLNDKRRLSPESAHFFDNVIAREVAILKNKDLKLNPINSDGLAFKIEGDTVKLYRQDNKPLVESNEVSAQIDPLMMEVDSDARRSKLKKKSVTTASATRERKSKDIEVQSADFQPKAEQKQKPLGVVSKDGVEVATEITVDEEDGGKIFDGSKAADQNQSSDLPVMTSVKERLVRFNLYFKPSKPDASGKRAWGISLPPNV